MSFSRKKTGIIITGILIVIAISFVTLNTNPKSSTPTQSGLSGEVMIGSILPLTGGLETIGEETIEATKLGVVDFNKHLDELKAPWHLKMISEDSATNPVVALEKLTALNAKEIKFIVGPATSGNIRNMKGYADSNNMLLVSCCSTAPALAIPNDGVFRLVTDDTNQGPVLAKLVQNAGIKVLITVWRGDTWGDGLEETTNDSFIQRGGVIGEGIRYDPESLEFSAIASLLAKKVNDYTSTYGTEKVAVLVLGFAETLQLMQSASEHDILNDIRWFGSDAITKEHRLTEDPIGLKFSTDVQFTSVQFAASNNPIYQQVENHLIELLGRAPSTYAHAAYDAVWLIGLSILDAQSIDVSIIKQKIPEIAEKHNGALGSIKLNEAGDLEQANYQVWGIRDTQWILLGEYDHLTGVITYE